MTDFLEYPRIDGSKRFGEPLPGVGSILSIWVHNDEVYASKANADRTAIETYKSTPDGWVLQASSRFDA